MLWHSLKHSAGYAGFGASLEVQAKFSSFLCPAQDTQHDLQNDLQMGATCSGLEVPGRGQAVNKVQLQLVPGLEPLTKRQGACRGQMFLVCGL